MKVNSHPLWKEDEIQENLTGMKKYVQRIISGGQTGGDMGGLLAAKDLGIPSGGCAPKGFKTERGNNPSLKTEFGLREHFSPEYPPRTAVNVETADCTIIFSNDPHSKGSRLTAKLCESKKREYLFLNPDEDCVAQIRSFIKSVHVSKKRKIVLNIAGNRESKSPGMEEKVRQILKEVFT